MRPLILSGLLALAGAFLIAFFAVLLDGCTVQADPPIDVNVDCAVIVVPTPGNTTEIICSCNGKVISCVGPTDAGKDGG